jgi:hypothetical protein
VAVKTRITGREREASESAVDEEMTRLDPDASLLVGFYCWLFTLCLLQTAKSYISSNKALTLRIGVIYALLFSSLVRIIFWVHVSGF